MEFKFNVNMTVDDYLKFNDFVQQKSPYGKKTLNTLRVCLAIILCLSIIPSYLDYGFTLPFFITSVLIIGICVLLIFLFPKFLSFTVKTAVKSSLKKNKPLYSPYSTLIFNDEGMIENTPNTSSSLKFSGIERVSVVIGQGVYFHQNAALAFVLPYLSFESQEQFDLFIDYVKTKFTNVDFYM